MPKKFQINEYSDTVAREHAGTKADTMLGFLGYDPLFIGTSTFSCIALFKSITVLCGIDSILHNIPYIQYECGNIPHNIVSPTKRCYGSEQCYVGLSH